MTIYVDGEVFEVDEILSSDAFDRHHEQCPICGEDLYDFGSGELECPDCRHHVNTANQKQGR